MERLWSPWRSEFIEAHSEDPGTASPFTMAWEASGDDRANLLLHRGHLAMVIMNRYPYNAGHLLVVPVRETASFIELRQDELHELTDLVQACVTILGETVSPDGFNIGMNIGRTSGAAIDQHVHMHIVPRWNGDTNFMPVLDETRVISQELTNLYDQLKPGFERLALSRRPATETTQGIP